jgi:hypothetical protein
MMLRIFRQSDVSLKRWFIKNSWLKPTEMDDGFERVWFRFFVFKAIGCPPPNPEGFSVDEQE